MVENIVVKHFESDRSSNSRDEKRGGYDSGGSGVVVQKVLDVRGDRKA